MLTTMVSPSQDIPVLCTSMWMRMGTRVLRRGSFRGVLIRLPIHVGPNGMNSKPSPTKSEFGSYTVLITLHDLRQLQTFICAIAHNPVTRHAISNIGIEIAKANSPTQGRARGHPHLPRSPEFR